MYYNFITDEEKARRVREYDDANKEQDKKSDLVLKPGYAFVVEALGLYGARLSDEGNIVTAEGVESSVKPVVKGKRLRMESKSGLIASGAKTVEFVCSFVEKFWYWEKI